MNHFLTIITLVVSLLAGACGSDPTSTQPGDTAPTGWSTGATDVVLQLDEPVNQPDPFAVAGAYPPFTLYGDGRILYRDRTAVGGALPPLMQARVSPAGVARLLVEAFEADVFGSPDTSRDETLSDPPVTIVRVNTDAASVDFSIGDNRRLHAFADRLETGWQSIVGDEIVDQPEPFAFETVLVLGSQRQGRTEIDAAAPLPVDLGAAPDYRTRVIPIKCVELSAMAFGEIREAAQAIESPYGATWESAGEPWSVIFRQLLPHEAGCDLVPDQ